MVDAPGRPSPLHHDDSKSIGVAPSTPLAAVITLGPALSDAGGATDGDAHHDRRFNDKVIDEVSDLSYYGYRYYDRHSFTWTQSDPTYRFIPDAHRGQPRRSLLYLFSLNNALRYEDPDGRDSTTCSDSATPACTKSTSPSDDADAAVSADTPAAIDAPKEHENSNITEKVAFVIAVGLVCEPCAIAVAAGAFASGNSEGEAMVSAGCSGAACSSGIGNGNQWGDLTDGEIESAVNHPGTSDVMVEAPAPTHARYNVSKDMMVNEHTVKSTTSVAGKSGDVSTDIRVHTADAHAPPGSNSATGNTMTITQGNGNRRMIPGDAPQQRWVQTKSATSSDMNDSHIQIHRR